MIKLFSDGADFDGIIESSKNKKIFGFTTNPSLMRKAGITDYKVFSKKTIEYLKKNRPDTCLSLEVFADDYDDMYKQVKTVNSWSEGYNVYIKIPVMNTKKQNNYDLIKQLSYEGIFLNVTAVFSSNQISEVYNLLNTFTPTIISVFAGRIADAGVDPTHILSAAIAVRENKETYKNVEFLWASPREPYNYIQAKQCGCDIITMTPDMIKKLDIIGKNLEEFSYETCQMFYNDAIASGYRI